MDYKKLLKDMKESFIEKDIVVEKETEREGERERGEAHRERGRGWTA